MGPELKADQKASNVVLRLVQPPGRSRRRPEPTRHERLLKKATKLCAELTADELEELALMLEAMRNERE